MTKWTHETINDEFGDRSFPAAAIYLTQDQPMVRTIDLMGAHVLLDVDADGSIVSIEILGPAVFLDLKDLGEYLKEEATELKADDERELADGRQSDSGGDGNQ